MKQDMRIKLITNIVLCSTLLVACQQGEFDATTSDADYPQDGVVRITTQLDNLITTRGTTAFAGSTLGLTLLPASGNTNYSYINERWNTADNGQSWSADNWMLWQSATMQYHIHSYAPYRSVMTDEGIITHTIATDQSVDGAWLASDLVGYTTYDNGNAPTFTPGSSLSNGMLNLTLSHRLSQLTVNCTFRGIWSDANVSIKAVRIINTPITVNYNTAQGTMSSAGSVHPILMGSATDAQSYKAIVAPVQIAANTPLLQVEISDGSVMYYTSNGYTFESGKGYTLNLKIGEDKVELVGDIQVVDWNDDVDMIPDGELGETDDVTFYYTGDLSDFPSDIPSDAWVITLTDTNVGLSKVSNLLRSLNDTGRRITLWIDNLEDIPEFAFI